MIDNTQTPTEQNETEVVENSANEVVRDPEGVLRKNKELIGKNKELAAQLAKLRQFQNIPEDFDFEKARSAMEALQQIEEENMQKRGEYEKLIEQKSKAYEERLEAERQRNLNIQTTLKQEKLALALIESGVLPDRVNYLVKELSEQVDLDMSENGFVLKKRGGIGDATEFNALVEDVRSKSPFFFAANIIGGTGGSASSGIGATSTKKWSDLSVPEKAQAIREANGDAVAAQKKYS